MTNTTLTVTARQSSFTIDVVDHGDGTGTVEMSSKLPSLDVSAARAALRRSGWLIDFGEYRVVFVGAGGRPITSENEGPVQSVRTPLVQVGTDRAKEIEAQIAAWRAQQRTVADLRPSRAIRARAALLRRRTSKAGR